MGLTIEDMMVVSSDRYKMKMLAGGNRWSNSISWILQVEDIVMVKNFTGKELVVTICLGFDTEEKLLALAQSLNSHHAAALVLNLGGYVQEAPQKLIDYCNENDFPLLSIPWNVKVADFIKDMSMRVFMQSAADEVISNAIIKAIENPAGKDEYEKDLLPYFDVDGNFQVMLITTPGLDEMDTVVRRRMGYRLQNYLENITHNGNFFYYDSCFVLVANALSRETMDNIVQGFVRRVKIKYPEKRIYTGVGSIIKDTENLHIGYQRAKAAVRWAMKNDRDLCCFDEIGLYRLLYSVSDQALLKEMGTELLRPLLEYDRKHHTDYVKTLETFLEYNGSIQAISEALFTHRNTIMYRLNNIKKMLGSNLETNEERLPYVIACMIRKM